MRTENGADEFCATYQVCASHAHRCNRAEQVMKCGVEQRYVNFDKCISYFTEAASASQSVLGHANAVHYDRLKNG
jgi:hypothetical protein